jgi:hypothetical protein
MQRISIVSVLVLAFSLLGAAPGMAAKKPKPKAKIAFAQVAAKKSCGVYYRYSC